jgi:hypothetical protein
MSADSLICLYTYGHMTPYPSQPSMHSSETLMCMSHIVSFHWQIKAYLQKCAIKNYTPSGAVKEVILCVTERAQKEVIARVGLGFGRCCP